MLVFDTLLLKSVVMQDPKMFGVVVCVCLSFHGVYMGLFVDRYYKCCISFLVFLASLPNHHGFVHDKIYFAPGGRS